MGRGGGAGGAGAGGAGGFSQDLGIGVPEGEFSRTRPGTATRDANRAVGGLAPEQRAQVAATGRIPRPTAEGRRFAGGIQLSPGTTAAQRNSISNTINTGAGGFRSRPSPQNRNVLIVSRRL